MRRSSPATATPHFQEAFHTRILPALHDFGPDFLLISAGFDAHRDDPLAQIELVEADFAWVTEKLLEMAEKHAGGRVVSTLEGGYNLEALGALHRRPCRGPDAGFLLNLAAPKG